MPEASIPSRFLEEVPPQLLEEVGGASRSTRPRAAGLHSPGQNQRHDYEESRHYSYEDEDQSAAARPAGNGGSGSKSRVGQSYGGPSYNSIDNIAEFFASRGKKFSRPKVPLPEPTGKKGFKPGQRVVHPKYGEGTVYKREGDGEDAKITVQFPRFGLKKLVEKFAQLEKA
jgi:DNA helicase-2/ATP-dependent DNA helicase PcrA